MPRELPNEAVSPTERDLPAAQMTDSSGLQTEFAQSSDKCVGGHVDQVTRQVERKPAITEPGGLPTCCVGKRDDQQSAGSEQSRGVRQRVTWLTEVLE